MGVVQRISCVDVPALPLQLLLRAHADWTGAAVAVVDKDRPQGRILWVNAEARRAGLLPGHTFAQGLSLARELRAAVVPEREIAAGVGSIAAALRAFSPGVEPADGEPGVFFVDASGLSRLYPSATAWSRAILADLAGRGFTATVVVGFRRFGVYAVARAADGAAVFARPEDEERAMRRVHLSHLALAPRARDALDRLGIRTVGDFLRLPPEAVQKRFGPDARRLHDFASGEGYAPLRPELPPEALVETIQFEPADGDAIRLLFVMKPPLHALCERLASRGRALAGIEVRFVYERGAPRTDLIRPAEPTLDEAVVIDLLRLRFEGDPLSADVAEIVMTAHEGPADARQLRLFFEGPRRDAAAAARALARIRAELGPEAVRRAILRDGHLPEAAFCWETFSDLPEAHPASPAKKRLVRRVLDRPHPLPPRARREPDGWLVRDFECGPVDALIGPFLVSGGWWRKESRRQYHYARTRRGDILWLYYDELRRRWFMNGSVE
ncbi:MAG: DNA polymerase Y family protein [Alphaproteobacteria bacterium]|uniref:DNA polymerase Y family protein n=1 Tax=Candidatus Nitrobium versatile TaxID=2884831 RepID=A0A953JAA6_9BACT|nr:DNA polymerase Y family protein [Candidatus Nitrobium versatile]